MRLQFEGSSEQQDAAFTALAALGAYNRGNKLSQLHELVRRLIDGQAKVRRSAVCQITMPGQTNQTRPVL